MRLYSKFCDKDVPLAHTFDMYPQYDIICTTVYEIVPVGLFVSYVTKHFPINKQQHLIIAFEAIKIYCIVLYLTLSYQFNVISLRSRLVVQFNKGHWCLLVNIDELE